MNSPLQLDEINASVLSPSSPQANLSAYFSVRASTIFSHWDEGVQQQHWGHQEEYKPEEELQEEQEILEYLLISFCHMICKKVTLKFLKVKKLMFKINLNRQLNSFS